MKKFFADGFASVIGAIGGYRDGPLAGLGTTAYAKDLAIKSYCSSNIIKSIINTTSEDRVREWRDWQADKDVIAKLEKEEHRLKLQKKFKEAEALRATIGGAIIIVASGDPASELRPEQIQEGGIVALNVVSRNEITPIDFDNELTSPNYRKPRMYQVQSSDVGQTKIHPSRVVAFRGREGLNYNINDTDAYWGETLLDRIYHEASRSDEVQAWFAALVRKAKLLRVGIPDLAAQEDEDLHKRVGLIAAGESVLNATLYSAKDANGEGEEISDYQVSWGGIPDVMDKFDQRLAAVAEMPFTKAFRRSPSGLNATGNYDEMQWNKAVKTAQELDMRPCLEAIDRFLFPSAGVIDDGEIWFEFAPLSVPSEKEIAEIFKLNMESIEKLQAANVMPEQSFNEGVQNLVIERGWLPGIEQSLDKVSDDERFGPQPNNDGTDPSSIQARREGDLTSVQGGGLNGSNSPPVPNGGR